MADTRQQFIADMANATNIVYNQLGRLKIADRKFGSMESYFLEQITQSIRTGNNAKAKVLAAELANVRRLRRTTQHTGLALEALVIRFSTMNEFATILDTIDPTVEMIKAIHADLKKAMPAAGEALNEVSSVTSDLLLNANIRADVGRISSPVDSDALSILSEIEGVLEDEAKSKLPEVPTGAAAAEKPQQFLEEQQAVLLET
jgi:division protein CdvB (Snf7/Vps24/ESCRT-III family)